VSSKISVGDFKLIEKYARIDYYENRIVQPTISHMLRRIIKNWAKVVRDKERRPRGTNHSQIEYDSLHKKEKQTEIDF
jgi:hypothetical protein